MKAYSTQKCEEGSVVLHTIVYIDKAIEMIWLWKSMYMCTRGLKQAVVGGDDWVGIH